MTSIHPDPSPYTLRRRLRHRKGGKPLGGFALDLVVRFDADGTAFVQDLNSSRNVMRFTDVSDLLMWLAPEIKRVHDEHFESPAAA